VDGSFLFWTFRVLVASVGVGLALTLAFCPETRGVDLRLVDAHA